MGNKQIYSSGSPWEPVVGYSRAVRVGNLIEVAGTTAVDEHGNVVGEGDAYQQACYILIKIDQALQALGANLTHVVRTRMFVTDISQWQAIGKAHGEVFADIRPVATMVEVKALIDPKLLVEIEVTAVVQ
jgi:enamine deaminase RidA (YjgF/YER057c/UK114 family)